MDSVEAAVDDDVREDYWHEVRKLPENAHMTRFRAISKHLAA